MTDVAVTTSADAFPRWAAAVAAAGLQPVELPCIEVVPAEPEELEQVRQAAASCDALLLTSPRAVALLWPSGDMPPVPVAAVGVATAEGVEEAGGTVEVEGSNGGDALVEEWSGVRGRRIVFPHALGADISRIETLVSAGAEVDAFPIYQARPISPGPDPVDAAVFASPSAVDGWLLSRSLNELRVVAAIGATTARAIEEAGGAVDAIPDAPSMEALVEALTTALEAKP